MRLRRVSILWVALLSPLWAFAQETNNFTTASANINSLLVIAVQLLVVGLFVLGVGFIFVGIAKYKKHKKMPTFVPLQTVVMMFLGGIFLIAVGVLYYYTGEHVFGPDYLSVLEPGPQTL